MDNVSLADPSIVSPAADAPPAAWVLVVEDDHDLRGLIATSVEEMTGLEVKAAADGQQAVGLIDTAPPNLVVTDLMMPNMDGYALFDWLHGRHPNVAVVAMSAAESKARALAAGFAAFLVKPFELDELGDVLGRWVAVA